LQFAFNEAAKGLPRGCRPDPICWCTKKFEELFEARNAAWATATSTNLTSDWKRFQEAATAFGNELKQEKIRAWEAFATTLDYNTHSKK